MARFKAVDSEFVPVPEGRYTWEIYDVEVDKIGTVKVKSKCKKGVHVEQYRIGKGKAFNEGALGFLTTLYRTVTGDYDAEDFDTDDMIGGKFDADMVHKQGEKTTFHNLAKISKTTSEVVEADDEDDEEDGEDYDPFA